MIYLILLLAFILRIINLNQSLWLDEASQVLLSKDSINNIIFNHGADFHPPLSYIFMHFWMFFNSSDIWVRLPSVIFGVLTVWVIYIFISKLFNPKTGLLTAVLLAVNPYHIYYSQEVRMYSEASFFACISMYYFYKLTKNKNNNDTFFYVLSTSALIYTHYDGLFLIVTQLLYIFFSKRDQILFFLKKFLLILLLYLPWLPQFFIQFTGGSNIDTYLPGWRSVLSISFYKAIPLIFFKFSFGRIDFTNTYLYIGVATIVLSVFGFILFTGIRNIKSKEEKLILYWLFIPIIVAILISFRVPINQPFRIIYVIPAYLSLLAFGITSLIKLKRVSLFLIVSLSVLGIIFYYFNPRYQREDWKGAVSFVDSRTNKDNLVIFAWPSSFPPYLWYSKNNSGKGVVPTFPASILDVSQQLAYVNDKKEVFFFQYLQELSDPNKNVQKALLSLGFELKNTYNFNGVGFIYDYIKVKK